MQYIFSPSDIEEILGSLPELTDYFSNHRDSSGNGTDFDMRLFSGNNMMGVPELSPGLNVPSDYPSGQEIPEDYVEDICSTKDHPSGWFAFIWFIFTIMFVLPLIVSLRFNSLVCQKHQSWNASFFKMLQTRNLLF